MKTVISDLQGVVMTNDAGLSGTFVENSLTIAGNVGFGSASPGAGKVIATITLTAGGTSYVNLNYAQQALTGGTGTGATADIRVVDGIVTVCTLRDGGVGYVVGDVLSCTTIGAGVGLIVTVTTVASSVASDGIVVAPRIGAGTTTPRSALDVVGGATIDGVAQRTIWNTGTNNPINVLASLSIGSAGAPAIIANPNAGAYVVTVTPVFDVSALTYQSSIGVYSSPVLYTSPAGYTGTIFGTSAAVYRREPGDTATAMQIQGVSSNVGIVSTVGSATTLRAFAYRGGVFNTAANHTINEAWFALTGFAVTTATSVITSLSAFDVPEISGVGTVGTFYGLRIRASTTPTITNRIGISQEDTLSRNFFAGSVGIGTTSPAELLAVQAPLGVNSVVDILSLKNPSDINAGVRISLRNVYGDLGGVRARQTDNGAGADDGVLELQTSTNAILSTKMTILSNGRVGIGTETPAYKLQVGSFAGYGGHVDGLSVDTIITRLVDFGSTGYSGSTIYMPSSGELLIRAGSSHSGPTRMSFYTQHDYATAERVCINNLGNVGIGTASPASALDVAGTITCDDVSTGIKLPASPGNADVQTLDCYQESTYTATDTSGAGLVFTVNNPAVCTRVGRLVVVRVDITYPATADTAYASLSVPFASIINGGTAAAYGGVLGTCLILANVNAFEVYASVPLTRQTNAGLSGVRLVFAICFQAS